MRGGDHYPRRGGNTTLQTPCGTCLATVFGQTLGLKSDGTGELIRIRDEHTAEVSLLKSPYFFWSCGKAHRCWMRDLQFLKQWRPLKGALRSQLPWTPLFSRLCGREGNSSTPQPKSRDKVAFLPDLSRTSRGSDRPLRVRMGFHFACLIVHHQLTRPEPTRQASRNRRT